MVEIEISCEADFRRSIFDVSHTELQQFFRKFLALVYHRLHGCRRDIPLLLLRRFLSRI